MITRSFIWSWDHIRIWSCFFDLVTLWCKIDFLFKLKLNIYRLLVFNSATVVLMYCLLFVKNMLSHMIILRLGLHALTKYGMRLLREYNFLHQWLFEFYCINYTLISSYMQYSSFIKNYCTFIIYLKCYIARVRRE